MKTLENMAEALHQLRKKYGLFYNPTDREILEESLEKISKSYLLIKKTSDDIINALVKKGKKQKQMMEMLASGEIEELINKKIRIINLKELN